MNFPARGVEIVRALYTANPQNDDERRIHIQRVGEQLVYELGPNWGNKKRAGLSDAFRSPDSIAYRESDGTVSVWDVQASSGQILVHDGKPADHPNLPESEATFMPCAAVNHLVVTPPGPPGPEPGTPAPSPGSPVDLGPVLAALADLRGIVEQLRDKPPIDQRFPVYTGSIGLPGWIGGNRPIELKPEGQ